MTDTTSALEKPYFIHRPDVFMCWRFDMLMYYRMNDNADSGCAGRFRRVFGAVRQAFLAIHG